MTVIGIILCALMSLVVSLYGLKYGAERSAAWLYAFCTAFAMDIVTSTIMMIVPLYLKTSIIKIKYYVNRLIKCFKQSTETLIGNNLSHDEIVFELGKYIHKYTLTHTYTYI